MDTTSFLTRIGASGALPRVIRGIVAALTGFEQVLTTRSSTGALLALPDVTVPYAPHSALLGLEAFPLALDGAAHTAARSTIGSVLIETEDAHAEGLKQARAVASQAMALATRGPLDVTSLLVEPTLRKWVETWFGLPGRGVSLLRSGRLIMHATFMNPSIPNGSVDIGGLARAVDWVDSQRKELAEAIPDAPAGTVGAALVERTGDAAVAARHLLGLTVGPLALGAWSLHLALADLLDRSWVLDSIETEKDAAAAYMSALRRHQPLPGVLRYNPWPREVPGNRTGSATVKVPAGPVLVATACADRLDPGSQALPLAFGSGPHRCLGPTQMAEMAGVILRALGPRSPRWVEGRDRWSRRDPGPSGVRSWEFPGLLKIQLLR